MLKNIIEPFNILVFLFLVQLTAIYVFWYAAVPISYTFEGKQQSSANPYLTELHFKNDEQKSYYENDWFPKQTNKVIMMVFQDYSLLDIVLSIDKYQDFYDDFKIQMLQHITKKKQVYLNNDKNTVLLLQSLSDLPLNREWRLQSLLCSNSISFDNYLQNKYNYAFDYDSILDQSNNRFNNNTKTYLLANYDNKIMQTINRNHYDQKYFKQGFNHTEKLFELQKLNETNMIFYFQQMDDYKINRIEQNYLPNKKLELQQYVNSSTQTIIQVLQQSKQLENIMNQQNNTNKNKFEQTIIAIGQFGYFDRENEDIDYSSKQKIGFTLGYDGRGFTKNKFSELFKKLVNQQKFMNQIDITATTKMLMGQPLLRNNLGVLIPQYFLNLPQVDHYIFANNYYTNFRQVEDLVKELQEKRKLFSFQILDTLEQLQIVVREKYKQIFQDNPNELDEDLLNEFIYSVIDYVHEVKEIIDSELATPSGSKLFYSLYMTIINTILCVCCCFQMNHYWKSGPNSVQFVELNIFQMSVILVLFFGLGISSIVYTPQSLSKILLVIFFIGQIVFMIYLYKLQYDSDVPFMRQLRYLFEAVKDCFVKFDLESAIDWIVFTLCVLIGLYSKLSKENSQNYNINITCLIAIIALSWLIGILFSKKHGLDQKKKILVKILIIFICVYISNYFNVTEQFQSSQLYNQLIEKIAGSEILNMYGTSIVYIMLQIKFVKLSLIHISRQVPFKVKYSFLLMQIGIIISTLGYFLCCFGQNQASENENSFENYLQKIFVQLSYLLFVSLGALQYFFLKQETGPVWNYTIFSNNFILISSTSLNQQGYTLLLLYLFILFSIGHISLNYKHISLNSKYPLLFLISLSYYYSTGHSEKINELFQIDFLKNNNPFDQGSILFLFGMIINIIAGFCYGCIILPYLYIIDSVQTQNTTYELRNKESLSFLDFIFDCSQFASQNSFQMVDMEQIPMDDTIQNSASNVIQQLPIQDNFYKNLKNSQHLLSCQSFLKLQFPLLLSIIFAMKYSQSNIQAIVTSDYFLPDIFQSSIIYFSLNFIFLIQYKLVKFDTILLRDSRKQ